MGEGGGRGQCCVRRGREGRGEGEWLGKWVGRVVCSHTCPIVRGQTTMLGVKITSYVSVQKSCPSVPLRMSRYKVENMNTKFDVSTSNRP